MDDCSFCLWNYSDKAQKAHLDQTFISINTTNFTRASEIKFKNVSQKYYNITKVLSCIIVIDNLCALVIVFKTCFIVHSYSFSFIRMNVTHLEFSISYPDLTFYAEQRQIVVFLFVLLFTLFCYARHPNRFTFKHSPFTFYLSFMPLSSSHDFKVTAELRTAKWDTDW